MTRNAWTLPSRRYDAPPAKYSAVVGLCISPGTGTNIEVLHATEILTERIFESALDCTYKCHLLLNGGHGNKSEYEEHTERLDNIYQRAAIARLQEMYSNKDTMFLDELTRDTLHNNARLVVIMHAQTNALKSDWIVLTRAKNTSGSYQPVLFHRDEEINTRTKLLLAFRSILIEKATGIVLSHGQIIYGPDFAASLYRFLLS
jgi:hypothetical protein